MSQTFVVSHSALTIELRRYFINATVEGLQEKDEEMTVEAGGLAGVTNVRAAMVKCNRAGGFVSVVADFRNDNKKPSECLANLEAAEIVRDQLEYKEGK